MSTFRDTVRLIEQLPEEVRQEVADFVRFLAEKHSPRPLRRKFRLDWAGALSDLKGKYTSVELQHKALDWWTDDMAARR